MRRAEGTKNTLEEEKGESTGFTGRRLEAVLENSLQNQLVKIGLKLQRRTGFL
jgi:hypothetical protein